MAYEDASQIRHFIHALAADPDLRSRFNDRSLDSRERMELLNKYGLGREEQEIVLGYIENKRPFSFLKEYADPVDGDVILGGAECIKNCLVC